MYTSNKCATRIAAESASYSAGTSSTGTTMTHSGCVDVVGPATAAVPVAGAMWAGPAAKVDHMTSGHRLTVRVDLVGNG